jgi:low affinity Fe/Cu permease
VATHREHRDDHRNLPDGLSDSGYPLSDGAAVQAKLDELIQASAAQNGFTGIEHLTQEELDEIRASCEAKDRAEIAAGQAEVAANRKAAKAAEKATS